MSSQRVAAAFSRMQERAGLRSRVGDARCSSKCVPARHWERARPPTNRRAGALGAPPPHDGNRGSLEFEFRTKITRRSDVSADSNRRNHRGPVSCSVVLIDGVVSARRKPRKPPCRQGFAVARPGLEPGTPRFSDSPTEPWNSRSKACKQASSAVLDHIAQRDVFANSARMYRRLGHETGRVS
jgi:hypothetical protein